MNQLEAGLPSARAVLRKKVVCWVLSLSGMFFGVFVLADLGAQEISPKESWYSLVVWFMVRLVPIVGSWIGIWNRRVAALTLANIVQQAGACQLHALG
jgi:hypothetical protein